MKRIVVFLAVVAAISAANPVAEIIFSEIQTAPDSLERIELHIYSGQPMYDLSGVRVVTRAGTAVIDSGVVLQDSGYVVIDRTNTTGTFSLADDSDHVRLYFPGDTWPYFELTYPANPYLSPNKSWAPGPGQSCALYQWWEYVPPGEWWDCYTWYSDETPSFGSRNDDTLGGISGHIYDDRGLPVNNATVRISSSQGAAVMTSGYRWNWPAGYFLQGPTGPGTFTVTAECPDHLPGAYPDPIVLLPNEHRQIEITLYRVGVAENGANAARVGLRQRGRALVLEADRPGKAFVTVHDLLGRVRQSEKVVLVSGSYELPLYLLSSGVYFASCRFEDTTSSAKLVLH